MPRLTKSRLLNLAQRLGVGYEANVIVCHQSNPTRRLRGLVTLADRGHDLRIGPTLDRLMIDGEARRWSDLESVR